MIDSKAVSACFMDCLFTEAELVDGQPKIAPVVAEGVTAFFGLHPQRLAEKRQMVQGWLQQLPKPFFHEADGGGGGWSFLNACTTEAGELWTGLHEVVEQLLVLGVGLGMVKWLMPRAMWSALPGGMPYFVVSMAGAMTTPFTMEGDGNG
jgi:hypothetical protein